MAYPYDYSHQQFTPEPPVGTVAISSVDQHLDTPPENLGIFMDPYSFATPTQHQARNEAFAPRRVGTASTASTASSRRESMSEGAPSSPASYTTCDSRGATMSEHQSWAAHHGHGDPLHLYEFSNLEMMDALPRLDLDTSSSSAVESPTLSSTSSSFELNIGGRNLFSTPNTSSPNLAGLFGPEDFTYGHKHEGQVSRLSVFIWVRATGRKGVLLIEGICFLFLYIAVKYQPWLARWLLCHSRAWSMDIRLGPRRGRDTHDIGAFSPCAKFRSQRHGHARGRRRASETKKFTSPLDDRVRSRVTDDNNATINVSWL
jgi:hypothetical protein